MKLKCPRCGKDLVEGTISCADLACCLKDAKNIENQNDEDKPKSVSIGIKGFLIILFFGLFLVAKALEFLTEFSHNGIISAIQNRPGIPTALGVIGIVWLLGSRELLEKIGLGFVHKMIKYSLFVVVALFILTLVFSAFPGLGTHGLPDNLRR